MTALAEGCAGLALVMGLAVLGAAQVSAAAILVAVQSAAVAVTAVAQHQPLLAVPPMILGAATWLLRHETPDPTASGIGGARLGLGIGAALAVLCQALGALALPAAVILLAILLVATRSHRIVQVVALVALQNGISLGLSLLNTPIPPITAALAPVACLVLPLPLALSELLPHAPAPRLCAWGRGVSWLGWIDLALAVAMLCATLVLPLDGLGRLFAPLLALDAVLRACVRRQRTALTACHRGADLAQGGCIILAACAPEVSSTWLALLLAMTLALRPALARRRDAAALAYVASGLVLCGLLLLSAARPVPGWFSLVIGFATIAAVVPDLAVVSAILILRLASQAAWPTAALASGSAIAAIGLLACAALLAWGGRINRVAVLVLGQAAIAVLSTCAGQEDGRFAALVLLVLLALCRAAARITVGPETALAVAGLGGVPPLGVFPGLVLVVLALGRHAPWLLLPLGVGLVPMVLRSLPRHLSLARPNVPSVAWLPLVLAVLAGYAAPNGLVQWWHTMTSGVVP